MEQLDKKQEIMYKDNALILARYNLNVVENRVFMLILYSFQKNGNGQLSCRIPGEAFRKIIKHRNGKTVNGIKSILKSLREKDIIIRELSPSGKSYNEYEYKMIQGHTYYGDTDEFVIESVQSIYDLVMKQFGTGGYTPVEIETWMSLRKVGAQRLYDLIRLWSGTTHKISYTVDQLKYNLMLEDISYTRLKKQYLEPGIEELNESGLFNIRFEESSKKGKAVTGITFYVTDNRPRNLLTKVSSSVPDSFVPFPHPLDSASLAMLYSDFAETDFSDVNNQRCLLDACLLAMRKDDVTAVTPRNYNYMKTILVKKLKKT